MPTAIASHPIPCIGLTALTARKLCPISRILSICTTFASMPSRHFGFSRQQGRMGNSTWTMNPLDERHGFGCECCNHRGVFRHEAILRAHYFGLVGSGLGVGASPVFL